MTTAPKLRTVALTVLLSLVTLLTLAQTLSAQEAAADDLLNKWFALYVQHAESVEMKADTEGDDTLELQLPPLLKYTNPVRSVQQHGSIFIWTRQGRPALIGSIWSALDREYPGKRRLNYEWHALLEQEITAIREGEQLWNSGEPGVEWQPLATRIEVARSGPLRLTQMRRIAQSYTTEIHVPEGQLRLMSQPIYRYPEETPGVLDGAVFAVVMGTDPELFILVEAQTRDEAEAEWRVAFARFTNAPLTVLREQREVWSCDHARAFETTGRFFLWFAMERYSADLSADDSGNTLEELPGVAP